MNSVKGDFVGLRQVDPTSFAAHISAGFVRVRHTGKADMTISKVMAGLLTEPVAQLDQT